MLAGSLNEFTMLDVFSLLATTRKTGVVNLADNGNTDPGGPDVTGRVWVIGGQISFAVAEVTQAPLVARLLHSGEIEEDAIRDVVGAHAPDATTTVADALTSLGLPDDRVREVIRDQVVDALFDMSLWEDGNFSFSARGDDDAAADSGPTFPSDEIMDAVQDRLQEWVTISRAIPAHDLVPGLVTQAPTGPTGQVLVDPRKWEVMTLIDGARTVADVISLTGQGVFTVCKLLAGMVDAGLVSTADQRDEGPAVAATFQRLLGAEQSILGAPAASLAPAAPAAPVAEAAPGAPAIAAPPAAAAPAAEPAPELPTPQQGVPTPGAEAPAWDEAEPSTESEAAVPTPDAPTWTDTTAPGQPVAPELVAESSDDSVQAGEPGDWSPADMPPADDLPVDGPEADLPPRTPSPAAAEDDEHDEETDASTTTAVKVNDDLLSRLIGGVSRG